MSGWELFSGDSDDESPPLSQPARAPAAAPPAAAIRHPERPRRPPSRPTELWSDFAPDYFGPLRLASGLVDVGGGRGYVAAEDLDAGTLLLAERAVIPYSRSTAEATPLATSPEMPDEDELLEAAFAEVRGSGGVLAPHFAEVHPTSLDMVDPEDVRETRRRAAARCGSDEGDAEVEAVTRLLLVLERSSFASGLYLHASIFNHAADASAFKLLMSDGLSEIWLTRAVRAGEPITISYTAPGCLCHSKQRASFARQHGFLPPPPGPGALSLMGSTSDSDVDAIEERLDGLDERLAWASETMETAPSPPQGATQMAAAASSAASVFVSADALRCDLVDKALGPSHVLRRRVLLLLAMSSALCISHGGPAACTWQSHDDGESAADAGAPQATWAASAALRWSLAMLRAVDECAWLGPLHPHAGDAAAVASRALQHLLSACPHVPLVQLVGCATGYPCDGVRAVYARERELRQRSDSIAKLYSR